MAAASWAEVSLVVYATTRDTLKLANEPPHHVPGALITVGDVGSPNDGQEAMASAPIFAIAEPLPKAMAAAREVGAAFDFDEATVEELLDHGVDRDAADGFDAGAGDGLAVGDDGEGFEGGLAEALGLFAGVEGAACHRTSAWTSRSRSPA